MKNLRNTVDIKLASNKKDCLKWVSKPSYILHEIFGNMLVAIHKSKVVIMLNKPAYIKMCILELSKVLMYEFHYDLFKSKYGNNWRLLFADTDSLMYEIKTEDVYENFSKDKEMFNFSNYSAKSKYDDSNKLVLGKMKMKQLVLWLKSLSDGSQRCISFW